MSNTQRNKRPRMKLARLSKKQHENGKVRAGTPQHDTKSCGNNGGCPVCKGNRTHKNNNSRSQITSYEKYLNEY